MAGTQQTGHGSGMVGATGSQVPGFHAKSLGFTLQVMENTEGLGELIPLTERQAKDGRIRDKQSEFGLRQVEFEPSVGPSHGDIQEAVRHNSLGL